MCVCVCVCVCALLFLNSTKLTTSVSLFAVEAKSQANSTWWWWSSGGGVGGGGGGVFVADDEAASDEAAAGRETPIRVVVRVRTDDTPVESGTVSVRYHLTAA